MKFKTKIDENEPFLAKSVHGKQLTMKQIREGIKAFKENIYTCHKCKTEKEWFVLGYGGDYCECEANKLAKTPLAQQQQKLIKGVMLQ